MQSYFMIADHPALDFLNTVVIEDGVETDRFQNDEDVLAWLHQAGFASRTERPLKAGRLLAAARELREAVRTAIKDRKQRKPIRIEVLNRFLSQLHHHVALVQQRGQPLAFHTNIIARDEIELLAQVAESAAHLLVDTDFDLVRQCEDESCILWFLDITKAHRRRWCSMSTCGNRQKVQAYRARKATGS
ncbi:CGNR zinc finger domain-containing protein [Edaphobacter flagellatus]|uniref:CGNR zinc finger domain-containing protein n=1 Tax=Edaphobacter flagellatus TaxID=1933044 RepID=UPI0028C4CB43|nr:ABATE domain-containing protein [Edaphobacter flagellatus]